MNGPSLQAHAWAVQACLLFLNVFSFSFSSTKGMKIRSLWALDQYFYHNTSKHYEPQTNIFFIEGLMTNPSFRLKHSSLGNNKTASALSLNCPYFYDPHFAFYSINIHIYIFVRVHAWIITWIIERDEHHYNNELKKPTVL